MNRSSEENEEEESRKKRKIDDEIEDEYSEIRVDGKVPPHPFGVKRKKKKRGKLF